MSQKLVELLYSMRKVINNKTYKASSNSMKQFIERALLSFETYN